MHFLFVEEKIIDEQPYNEILLAKDLRIGTQYCAAEQIDKEKLKTDSTTARNFVLKMEEIIENVTEAQINKIRLKLTNARLLYAYSQLYPAPAPYNRRGFVKLSTEPVHFFRINCSLNLSYFCPRCFYRLVCPVFDTELFQFVKLQMYFPCNKMSSCRIPFRNKLSYFSSQCMNLVNEIIAFFRIDCHENNKRKRS